MADGYKLEQIKEWLKGHIGAEKVMGLAKRAWHNGNPSLGAIEFSVTEAYNEGRAEGLKLAAEYCDQQMKNFNGASERAAMRGMTDSNYFRCQARLAGAFFAASKEFRKQT